MEPRRSSLGWLLIAVAVPIPIHGQTDTTRADSTDTGYRNPAFGGPSSPGATLEADNGIMHQYGRLPIQILTPYYDAKKRIRERSGRNLLPVLSDGQDGAGARRAVGFQAGTQRGQKLDRVFRVSYQT